MKFRKFFILVLSVTVCLSGCNSSGNQETTTSDASFLQSQFWLPTEQILYDENGNELIKNSFVYDRNGMLVSASLYNGDTATQINEWNGNSVTCATSVTTSYEKYESKRTYHFNESDVLILQDWGTEHSFSQSHDGNGVNTFLDEKGSPFVSLYGSRRMHGLKFPLFIDIKLDFPTPYCVLDEEGNLNMKYDTASQTYAEFIKALSIDKNYQYLSFWDYPYGLWQNKTINEEDQTVTTTILYKNGNIGEKVTWRPVSKKAAQVFYYSDVDQLWVGGALRFLRYEAY